MPALGKSVVPCERAVINIGITQRSLAELMADPAGGRRIRTLGPCYEGVSSEPIINQARAHLLTACGYPIKRTGSHRALRSPTPTLARDGAAGNPLISLWSVVSSERQSPWFGAGNHPFSRQFRASMPPSSPPSRRPKPFAAAAQSIDNRARTLGFGGSL
jgi:hypothetical protein